MCGVAEWKQPEEKIEKRSICREENRNRRRNRVFENERVREVCVKEKVEGVVYVISVVRIMKFVSFRGKTSENKRAMGLYAG